MYNLLVQTVFILSFTFLKPTNYINTYYKEEEGSKIFLLLFLLLFATPLPVHCKEGEELWYLRFSTVFVHFVYGVCPYLRIYVYVQTVPKTRTNLPKTNHNISINEFVVLSPFTV